ncbi:hypothetical protein N7471_005569 [Penicillium samsonianum]|uniref:uncharacterized protein n=1 Tax=Penicillium samsonianum TaxID=1882272 RepID=UPI002547CE4F|nr:uncharacterized protein N7471_005569 [Penicillium samsonianum]KAJ6139083.1 hypothetical protein N7471_005569 [Penicillium samsonianum]
MTPSSTTQPKKAPAKRGRAAAVFDRNHEFLLHCITQSNVRIDYAAVGECEGISEKQARRRFYRLKAQISSHENDTEAEKQGQKDKGIQDGNDAKENS